MIGSSELSHQITKETIYHNFRTKSWREDKYKVTKKNVKVSELLLTWKWEWYLTLLEFLCNFACQISVQETAISLEPKYVMKTKKKH